MENKISPVETVVPQEVIMPIPTAIATQLPTPAQENSAEEVPPVSRVTSKVKMIMWVTAGIISLTVIFFSTAFIYGFAKGRMDTSTKSATASFISAEKDFQVIFPGTPTRKIEPIPLDDVVTLPMIVYELKTDKGYYAVSSIVYPKTEINFNEIDNRSLLDAGAKGASEEAKTTIDSMTYGNSSGNAYVDVFHSDTKQLTHQRLIIIDNSMYQVIVIQEKGKTDDSYKAFFDSFKYTDTSTQTMISPTTSKENVYTNKEVNAILEGNDKEAGKKMVTYIAQNPNAIDQFYLFNVAMYAFEFLGNKEQGTFLYYVAQTRTRAYARSDPDQSASSALRASLMDAIGRPINEWVGSDVVAWHELSKKAIAYEKKLPDQLKPSYVKTDTEWKALVDKERSAYEEDFNKIFTEKILNEKSIFEAGRKKNGLYVGPWKDSGEPLPKEWQ